MLDGWKQQDGARLAYPRIEWKREVRAVFQRRFGRWMKHPMVRAAQSLTLAQLAEMAAVYLPQKTIEDTLKELRAL